MNLMKLRFMIEIIFMELIFITWFQFTNYKIFLVVLIRFMNIEHFLTRPNLEKQSQRTNSSFPLVII